MNDPIETIDYRGYRIKLYRDDGSENPMNEMDMFGTVVTTGNRYFCGEKTDDDPFEYALRECVDPDELQRIDDRVEAAYSATFKRFHYASPEFAERNKRHEAWSLRRKLRALESSGAVAIPVYMHAHSGVSISAEEFNDPWDSGQVGYIYAAKEKVDKEFNGDRKSAVARLKAEIATIDQWLQGDVYFRTIAKLEKPALEPDGELEEGEEVESCGGFYGLDYAIAESKSTIDDLVRQDIASQPVLQMILED